MPAAFSVAPTWWPTLEWLLGYLHRLVEDKWPVLLATQRVRHRGPKASERERNAAAAAVRQWIWSASGGTTTTTCRRDISRVESVGPLDARAAGRARARRRRRRPGAPRTASRGFFSAAGVRLALACTSRPFTARRATIGGGGDESSRAHCGCGGCTADCACAISPTPSASTTRLGALERGDRKLDPRSLRALSVFYQTDAARLEAEMARWREQRGPRLPWVRNSGAWVRA